MNPRSRMKLITDNLGSLGYEVYDRETTDGVVKAWLRPRDNRAMFKKDICAALEHVGPSEYTGKPSGWVLAARDRSWSVAGEDTWKVYVAVARPTPAGERYKGGLDA